jgi:hypothetical protein
MKNTGDMAQVLEYLPSKYVALSSNPSTIKKQQRENKNPTTAPPAQKT